MNVRGKKLLAGIVGIMAFCFMAACSQAGLRLGDSREGDGDFAVTFAPTKTAIKVKEDVRFKVKANKKFFLYLFSISEEGEGVMLLPGNKQKAQVYQANQEYILPDKNGGGFVADKPGTEEVIMVASTKKLDLDHGKYKSIGQFSAAKGDDIQDDVKSLRIRAQEEKAQQVVQTVRLEVTGKTIAVAPGRADSPADGVPFVACNKETFKDGEHMTISYGADKAGFIYLWFVDESGVHFLKKDKVDGERFNKTEGVAGAPYGAQKLVAVWDKKGELNEKTVNLADIVGAKPGQEAEVKGITLTEKPTNYATYQVDISKK